MLLNVYVLRHNDVFDANVMEKLNDEKFYLRKKNCQCICFFQKLLCTVFSLSEK